jgi:predicted site-specific integrase-resolvase
MSNLVTASQLANELQVSTWTLNKWRRQGRITATMDLPGFLRFDPDNVRRQLAEASAQQIQGRVPTY